MATFTVRSRTLLGIASATVTAATREAAIFQVVGTGTTQWAGTTGSAEIQVLSAE
jgi:hypothetical protein